MNLDDTIIAAYTKLASRPGAAVGLAAVRKNLAQWRTRGEVDTALLRLHSGGRIHLEPEPLRHRLDAEAREAAIRIGGESRHLMLIY